MPWKASEIDSMKIHWKIGLLNKSRQLRNRTKKRKKKKTCQLQGYFLEGQEARPEEQHLGMAAGIFGSVKHTKVTWAWAFHKIWEWPRKECWGWTLTLVWNQNTICYNKLQMLFHIIPWGINALNISSVQKQDYILHVLRKTLTLRPVTGDAYLQHSLSEAVKASTTGALHLTNQTLPSLRRSNDSAARRKTEDVLWKKAASDLPGEATITTTTTTSTATIYRTTHITPW